MESTKIAVGIWGWSCIVIGLGLVAVCLLNGEYDNLPLALLGFPVAAMAGLPALLLLTALLPWIGRVRCSITGKYGRLGGLLFFISLCYGIITFILAKAFGDSYRESLNALGACTGLLFAVSITASFMYRKTILAWMGSPHRSLLSIVNQLFHHLNKPVHMHSNQNPGWETEPPLPHATASTNSNKHLIKAVISGGLILAMLIPTQFVSNLVEERAARQEEVTKEISSKWAAAQTISTPYLCIPYNEYVKNDTGRIVMQRQMLFTAANDLDVKADMLPELRKRGIYEVLLYTSKVHVQGSLRIRPAKDIPVENLLLNEARLCMGISDFRGIEEKINASFHHVAYEMEPGLPDYSIDKQGLSVPVALTMSDLSADIPFALDVRLKGSGQLHFLPLSDNSQIEIRSTWPNPSFDGSTLPREREVTETGFVASWSFNKANLPVVDQILKTDADRENLSFGVSMVQPADHYAKTNRSTKYAILFVGLTFAMFFIIELLQKKNVHPVQYLLIGLALVIFYTLLLSISEYTGFNIAYTIAASATVLLIACFAGSLFKSIKTSVLLAAFIGLLYAFIYVLIQLEDTALLAGSIGLFVILAVAMYFSRRINWYGTNAQPMLSA